MSYIIKATPALLSGGLAVIKRSFSKEENGTVNYECEYCCLAQFQASNIGKFSKESTPPTELHASMSGLGLLYTPKLYSLIVRTEYGLTYFTANYAGASSGAGEYTITRSAEQSSFSTVVSAEIRTGKGTPSKPFLTQSGFVTVSFDYISYTSEVATTQYPGASVYAAIARGSVSDPFNRRVTKLGGLTPSVGGYNATTIEITTSTKNSKGVETYVYTSRGVYVPTSG